MAALDFPSSPAVNESYTGPNGVTYKWSGVYWGVVGSGGGDGGGGGTTTGGGDDLVFQENEMICNANFELTNGRSALSAGPVTIDDGVEITIPDDQNWVIL
tara:strand:- start:245 stop:547 length:303 start_codon:yes stop_codon:yes gene_type:complete